VTYGLVSDARQLFESSSRRCGVFSEIEMPLILVLATMDMNGVRLDSSRIWRNSGVEFEARLIHAAHLRGGRP
jgi:DNA polymerase I-like protein with 3'-5' exonuclease and polymerase domains